MGAQGISDDELAGLSAEEREALGVDDDDAASLKDVLAEAGGAGGGDDADDAGGAAGGGAGDDDDDDDGAAGADADGGGKSGAAGKDAGKDEGAAGADGGGGEGAAGADGGQGDDDGEERFTPRYTAEPPENYKAQVEQINTELIEARRAWKAGDLSDEELATKETTLGEQRMAIERQMVKAEISAETQEQQAAQEWAFEVKTFMREAKRTDGIDYNDPKNKKMNADLDAFVKVLGGDPENADRDGEWFLKEAHAMVKAKHGIGKVAAPAASKAADAGADKSTNRRPPVDKLPKTLGGLPAAGATEAGQDDGEFSHLDKLDGLDLERAVARLTPEQQDRYART